MVPALCMAKSGRWLLRNQFQLSRMSATFLLLAGQGALCRPGTDAMFIRSANHCINACGDRSSNEWRNNEEPELLDCPSANEQSRPDAAR